MYLFNQRQLKKLQAMHDEVAEIMEVEEMRLKNPKLRDEPFSIAEDRILQLQDIKGDLARILREDKDQKERRAT